MNVLMMAEIQQAQVNRVEPVSEDIDAPFLTPLEALKEQVVKQHLTLHERKEITNYPEIYCFGRKAKKVYENPHNNGFDSESRSYCVVMRDHIQYRYEILRQIGLGYSSKVYKAFDHKTRTVVALKCFRNDAKCQALADKEEAHLRRLNELDMNRQAQGEAPANIIRLLDAFVFRKHRFVVLELLAGNLFSFLKDNQFPELPLPQVRAIAISILRALDLLYREKIVHGDLKPENLVFRHVGKTGIKLIDFGTSCLENEAVHSYYQTRYYRAPEVLLAQTYGLPIDMWSYGCILAELATGRPLFACASEAELLGRMVDVLGPAPLAMQELCRKSQPQLFQIYFNPDGSAKFATPGHIPGGPAANGRGLRNALSENVNEHFVDFLQKCLTWDPLARITPLQAASHLWLKL